MHAIALSLACLWTSLNVRLSTLYFLPCLEDVWPQYFAVPRVVIEVTFDAAL